MDYANLAARCLNHHFGTQTTESSTRSMTRKPSKDQNGCAATMADLTAEGLILPRVAGRDTLGVIQELSKVLQKAGCVQDLLPFYTAAMNREFLAGTVLDAGIAFPHARIQGLSRVHFAMGRCDPPVAWGLKGGLPVRLVFLVAAPATDATGYLGLVSALVRLSCDGELVEQLCRGSGASAILEILGRVSLDVSGASAPHRLQNVSA